MNSKIIIFGNNSFAKMLAEYVGDRVVCFTVEREFITEDQINGLPVVAFEELAENYSIEEYDVLAALGYKDMNSLRERIFSEVRAKGYKIASFVHPSAVVNADRVGEGNIFFENVYIGKYSNIGDGNIFWNGANISHNAEIGNFNYFSPSVVFSGDMEVGNNCFFGTNCTTVNGVKIADKTLVGAGCVVHKDTEENGVYVPEREAKLDKASSEIHLK